MAEIALNNITKYYGNTCALDNVSFHVEDGEFLVLLGPSGAGKTTTLKIIAGLEKPDDGQVLIDGELVNDKSANQRDLAMAFENYALYPHLTVYQNLESPLRAPGRRMDTQTIRKIILEISEILGIDRLLDRRPSELSGGQKQRVSLGRTLVRTPKAFLLDEPLSHVDAKIRSQLRIKFHELSSLYKSTCVYVTHDYIEALSLGQRIVVINEGHIHQIGTPREIYESPRDTFVARSVGQPEINLILCHVEDGGRTLVPAKNRDAFSLPVPAWATPLIQARREVIIGIRPQHLAIVPASDGHLRVTVDVCQVLGSFGALSITAGQVELLLRTRPDLAIAHGNQIGVNVDESKILFFDSQTGRNLTYETHVGQQNRTGVVS